MAWKKKQNVPVEIRGKRETVVIDAAGKPVGRLATQIAHLLMGKDKPTYVPHLDTGAFVKVLNVGKMVLTGHKMTQKVLYRSSNRPSGVKATPVAKILDENPGYVLHHAVKYMLPKNTTQTERMKRLIIA